MAGTWSELSKEISQAVEQAGRSIVAVDGRSGHTCSGIVWRADSILTAAHSIRSDTNLRVIAGPGRSIPARLSGRDRGTDVAILKLDKEIENPPVQFGNTASLSVGELTVAVARTRRGNIVASPHFSQEMGAECFWNGKWDEGATRWSRGRWRGLRGGKYGRIRRTRGGNRSFRHTSARLQSKQVGVEEFSAA
jgi:hypothetical protein